LITVGGFKVIVRNAVTVLIPLYGKIGPVVSVPVRESPVFPGVLEQLGTAAEGKDRVGGDFLLPVKTMVGSHVVDVSPEGHIIQVIRTAVRIGSRVTSVPVSVSQGRGNI